MASQIMNGKLLLLLNIDFKEELSRDVAVYNYIACDYNTDKT